MKFLYFIQMKSTILGAIVGDVIGSIYEFYPTKDYNFPLFDKRMEITDDSIMTITVADWLLHTDLSHEALSCKMRLWGNKYPDPLGGYGRQFYAWLKRSYMGAYNSWGNGSAMRVSPIGFAFDELDKVLYYAKISAEVTHNHIEGIKGAQATAAAIFMARKGINRELIRNSISRMFNYNLNLTCNDIRPNYHFQESCQRTVPQSIVAFLDSKNYEDAIRLAVSLGGDADTMGAITGGIAAAFYDMPEEMCQFAMSRIPQDLKEVVIEFESKYGYFSQNSPIFG